MGKLRGHFTRIGGGVQALFVLFCVVIAGAGGVKLFGGNSWEECGCDDAGVGDLMCQLSGLACFCLA